MWDATEFTGQVLDAVSSYDRKRTEELCDDLVKHLRSTEGLYDEDEAKRVLGHLRRKRYFDLMQRTADVFIQSGLTAPQMRRQYAQALLDQGSLSAGISVLEKLIQETPQGSRENREVRGLLGRGYKQMYMEAGGPTSARIRSALSNAVQCYYDVYKEDRSQRWHGINTAALLDRAERDGVAIEGVDGPRATAEQIAKAILEDVEEAWNAGDATMWDAGTAAEACVALMKPEEALRWTVRYSGQPRADAFELTSTRRQFLEVWQLTTAEEPGASVLPVLTAELLQREGSEVEIGGSGLEAGSLGELSDDRLERVLGNTSYVTFLSMLDAIERGRCVARIEDTPDHGHGTGFALPGVDLHPLLGEQMVLVTNAHVVSDDPRMMGQGALDPEGAIVAFTFLGGKPGRDAYRVKKREWTSPSWKLDATVLSLTEPVEELQRYPMSRRLPVVGDPSEDARVYVIGHPKGGSLSFSIQDNQLLDHEGPPEGEPSDAEVVRLRYRAPTDPGSSGSPVFNKQWKLIGLHHAGDDDWEPLNGKQGDRYAANEGIWIQSIREALERELE